MSGVNKVFILGRVGRDPEITYTSGGMAICKISIATSRKGKDGKDVTSWHRCTAFQKSAEAIGKYVAKGQVVHIEGELSYGQYEKDGVTHYTTDILVHKVTFIGGQVQGDNNQKNAYKHPGPESNRSYGGRSTQGGYIPPDDDIPF